jgi:hypothetical protein
MNADSQAITLEITSKIAHLAVLFRAEFPPAGVDLQPWLTDSHTQGQLDPHSIDLSFFFPEHNLGLECRCLLMQVRFSEGLTSPTCQMLSVEASGFDSGRTQQWQFSTIDWQFTGDSPPESHYQERFRHLTQRILRLFRCPIHADSTFEG